MFNKLVNDEVTGNFVLQSNATKHVTKAVEESWQNTLLWHSRCVQILHNKHVKGFGTNHKTQKW